MLHSQKQIVGACDMMLTYKSLHHVRVNAKAKLIPSLGAGLRLYTRSWPDATTTTNKATEFEHAGDMAFRKLLPKPGPSGFSRGSFINFKQLSVSCRADEANKALIQSDLPIESIYEFTAQVGKGGFGTVHAAKHRLTGELVAIKKIDKGQVQEAEILQLEVEFLKVADHPNVVRYYETLEDDNYLYLVMEMCSGQALSKHIKDAHESGMGFSEEEMARIMIQMLRGISYCHAHAIVHRDVKPENFIFGRGNVQSGRGAIPVACSSHLDAPLKMVDFGISGVVRRDKNRWLTKRVGTDGFMAPEVLSDKVYGPKADMFSLGAAFHNMITGRKPVWQNANGGYKFPGSMRWDTLSSDGTDLLLRLLCEDPGDRPTASEAKQHPWFRAMGAARCSSDQGFEAYLSEGAVTRDVASSLLNFACQPQLQRAIMYCMVAFVSLHNHVIEELTALFVAADRGTTGGINRSEFSSLLRACGMTDAYKIEVLFCTINVSHTGSISYSEWLAAALPTEWYDAQDFRRAFDIIDMEGKGYIRASDLDHLLPQVFNVAELEVEIRCHWPSSDGKLSFEDFCRIVQLQDATSQWLYPWY